MDRRWRGRPCRCWCDDFPRRSQAGRACIRCRCAACASSPACSPACSSSRSPSCPRAGLIQPEENENGRSSSSSESKSKVEAWWRQRLQGLPVELAVLLAQGPRAIVQRVACVLQAVQRLPQQVTAATGLPTSKAGATTSCASDPGFSRHRCFGSRLGTRVRFAARERDPCDPGRQPEG